MKNNENNKYLKTAEITDEKKSQILKHSISCHADDHAAEELNHHNDEYKNRQEHVVHVINIIFNRTDSDDCSASVVKK